MNRRQKKKAYKKKYGHNPPKTEMQYHSKEWGRNVSRVIKNVAEAIRDLVPTIKKVIDSVANGINEGIEHIKTMPEEDFNRFLDNPEMDEGTKALARQIRRAGQNGYKRNDTAENCENSRAANPQRGTPDNCSLHGRREDNGAGNE